MAETHVQQAWALNWVMARLAAAALVNRAVIRGHCFARLLQHAAAARQQCAFPSMFEFP